MGRLNCLISANFTLNLLAKLVASVPSKNTIMLLGQMLRCCYEASTNLS